MNRRSFLTSILQAGISAAILPAATKYVRRWKRTIDKDGFPVLWIPDAELYYIEADYLGSDIVLRSFGVTS